MFYSMTRVVGFGAALEDIWPEFSAYLLSQLILGELNLFRIVGQFWSNPTFLNLAKFMRCATLKPTEKFGIFLYKQDSCSLSYFKKKNPKLFSWF